MTKFESAIYQAVNDFIDTYGKAEFLEAFFEDQNLGEIIVEMYNAGIIPSDKLERFVGE